MKKMAMCSVLLVGIGAFLYLTPRAGSLAKFATQRAGDVDLSGAIDAVDVQLVINTALGLTIDSDGDGLCDGAEARWGSDANQGDSDADGVGDLQEYFEGTLEPVNGGGNIFYVSESGLDTNPGTEEAPWRTIQHAADVLTAGQTVRIRAGTYVERVVPQNSGTAGNEIGYEGFPGEIVTVDGTGVDVPEWGGLIDMGGRQYIRVSGLRVTNVTTNPHNPGILADTASYITIDGCFVNNTNDSGIMIWNSDHVIIENNEVAAVCQSGYNEGITVGATNTFEVRNNVVHDNAKEGICVKDGTTNGLVYGNVVYDLSQRVGIYLDAWDDFVTNVQVFRNIVHDVAGDVSGGHGIALACESGGYQENISVYNNVVYHNGLNGLTIGYWGDPAPNRVMRNVRVINNTFYDNGTPDWGGGISIENPDAQDIVIRNNICSQNQYYQIRTEFAVTGLTIERNLIDGFRGNLDDETRGTDFVEGAAAFVNASNADFHLTADSPARDAGLATDAPEVDFDGVARPQGSAVDVGAYEFFAR
ncbi:MAG: right-handed parallel beta-helix repeat-containing protein [Candidatus Hydrogenedentes bacterium]|nr:right-handed parallel beta-helix repeat-containing protein [Candidatus Hydrogenedentota bacterium]